VPLRAPKGLLRDHDPQLVCGKYGRLGAVVGQVRVTPTSVHVYHVVPAATSLIFMVEPATGAVLTSNTTESMLNGLVAFRL